jgi:gliding motility-associated lipoprotein GldJ
MMITKNVTIKALLGVLVIAVMASCSKGSSNKNTSSITGWKINDKKGGFTYNTKFKKHETPPGMVPIEGGTFTMGRVQDDVMHDWNNSPNQQHIQSIFMDESEVTNFMYLEYLYWLKNTFDPNLEEYKEIYYGAIPDTLVWRNRLGYNEQMVLNYLRHPAYKDYPVVGVNWIQANEFCKWRTNALNQNILEKEKFIKKDAKILDSAPDKTFDTETYINAPSKTMGGDEALVLKGKGGKLPKGTSGKEPKNLYVQRTAGILMPDFRLPTEAEWEYAAVANVENREFNLYKGQKKYPWSGMYTRNGKRSSKGDQLANFKMGKGDYGGIAGWSDDGADITQKVKSYPANDFGLYDMAGNVNEWVADVYRTMVDDEANDFNYARVNKFTKNKIGEDGKVELITKENMNKDTLSNGKIIVRSYPGQIKQVPVDENETYLRQNFDKSDNLSYRDGEKSSSRYYRQNSEGELTDTKRMYDSPIHKVGKDSTGLFRKYDRSTKRTSLINDQTRVYKGGSWRDRAYWIDPSTRRHYPQDMATDDIGFRCAMNKFGPKSNKKSSRGNPKAK